MRRTALVLLAATLLAPATAHAAPKPVPKRPCAWADPAGDARAPERDITCVDFGAGAKEVVIVLRLAGPAGKDQAGLVAGETWSVSLVASGVRILATRERSALLGKDTWSVAVGDAPTPASSFTVSVGSDGSLVWHLRRAGLGLRPRLVVSAWAAGTTLAGRLADDSAGARSKP